MISYFFFFKQKTAYEMRISDWSSDVCSSDLVPQQELHDALGIMARLRRGHQQSGKLEEPLGIALARHRQNELRKIGRDRRHGISGFQIRNAWAGRAGRDACLQLGRPHVISNDGLV